MLMTNHHSRRNHNDNNDYNIVLRLLHADTINNTSTGNVEAHVPLQMEKARSNIRSETQQLLSGVNSCMFVSSFALIWTGQEDSTKFQVGLTGFSASAILVLYIIEFWRNTKSKPANYCPPCEVAPLLLAVVLIFFAQIWVFTTYTTLPSWGNETVEGESS